VSELLLVFFPVFGEIRVLQNIIRFGEREIEREKERYGSRER
jgi:hypothetical protein